jgi:hypothetical protein
MIQKRSKRQSDSVYKRVQLRVVKEAKTLKTMDVSMKIKHYAVVQLGEKQPYSSGKDLNAPFSGCMCEAAVGGTDNSHRRK